MVQQQLCRLEALGAGLGVEDDGDVFRPVPQGGGGKAVHGLLGEAGLEAGAAHKGFPAHCAAHVDAL